MKGIFRSSPPFRIGRLTLGEYIDVSYGRKTIEGKWLHKCLRGFTNTLREAAMRGESVICLPPLGRLVLMISEDPQRRRRHQPFYYEWRASRRLRLGSRKGRNIRMSWIDVFTLSQEMDDLDYAIIRRIDEADPTKEFYLDDLLELKAQNKDEMKEGVLDRCRLIINWQTREKAIGKEIEELKEKQLRIRRIIKACREFVLKTMEQYEVQQIKDDLLTISVRRVADRAAVEVLDVPEPLTAELRVMTESGRVVSIPTIVNNKFVTIESIQESLLKTYASLDVKRGDIKKAIQAGETVPGAWLITDQKTVNIRR